MIRRATAFVALLLFAGTASAHGLLVSIRSEGAAIFGKVYYSSGEAGAGQYVELTDLDAPAAAPVSAKTDAQGAFRFTGIPGHRYRFVAEGEEGHHTEMRITLANGAKGRFVDRDAAPTSAWPPPAWAVIGGGLLLLSLAAFWSKRRRGVRP